MTVWPRARATSRRLPASIFATVRHGVSIPASMRAARSAPIASSIDRMGGFMRAADGSGVGVQADCHGSSLSML